MGKKMRLRKALNLAFHALRGEEKDYVVIGSEILAAVLECFRTLSKRDNTTTETTDDNPMLHSDESNIDRS